jgi:hypothetical protein
VCCDCLNRGFSLVFRNCYISVFYFIHNYTSKSSITTSVFTTVLVQALLQVTNTRLCFVVCLLTNT